nr:MAG TPA: hypothetical protein [Caudoviricetes sp.]
MSPTKATNPFTRTNPRGLINLSYHIFRGVTS